MRLENGLSTLLFGAILATLSSPLSAAAPATSPAQLDWIQAKGTQLVDAHGNPLALHGVNIGGWLVEEMWMMPFQPNPPAGSDASPIKDHVTLWNTIEKRLGPQALIDVRTALRNAWFDQTDMDRIKASGFNCIRLPFFYSLLDESGGWSWLDRAIDWAAQRRIYVILDLHGAPGGQSKAQHCGQAGVNQFFKDPADIAAGCAVWKKLAARYADRPEVAGYDLLNEPMGAPNPATLFLVQDQLIHAIREIDKRHVIFIEDGYLGTAAMPDPAVAGWTNVAYSFHQYKFDSKSADDQRHGADWFVDKCAKLQARLNIPLYIGEFNQVPHGNGQTIAEFTRAMDAHQWPWSIWCYKVVIAKGGGDMWGIYHNPNPVEAIDPFQDTAQQMIAKTAAYRTDRLALTPELKDAFQK